MSATSSNDAATWDVLVCGSLNVDLVSRVPYLPAAGETLPATHLLRLPGGKGLNQAVAAARQAARTALIGATGRDAEATLLRETIALEQVHTTGVAAVSGVPTGLALINVAEDGENSIVVHGGANAELDAEWVRAAMQPARVYLAQQEVPVAALTEFFALARTQGGIRILNAAPSLPATFGLLKDIDILIVNEGEAEALRAGLTSAKKDAAPEFVDIANPHHELAAAQLLLTAGPSVVIVTLGERGALVVTLDETLPLPAPRVQVVDTTGAGDCFCGVFAAALAAGEPLASAASRAVAAATQAVQSMGAIAAMPRR